MDTVLKYKFAVPKARSMKKKITVTIKDTSEERISFFGVIGATFTSFLLSGEGFFSQVMHAEMEAGRLIKT